LGLDNKPHFCYNEYNKTREDKTMNVIESAIKIQITQEEQDKIREAHEVIAHLYDIMLDYEQEFICGASDSYSLAQVRDASNLMAMLLSSKEFRLENL